MCRNKESCIGIGDNKESSTDMCYNKETAAERHSGLCRKSVSVSPIRIRPHHGMCLAFFKGHGYSSGFCRHMQEMLELFETNVTIRMHVDTDEICSACPNNQNGMCSSAGSVADYDKAVLALCGLEEGAEMPSLEFARKVQEEIFHPGRRIEICGDCQWNEICAEQKSRWGKLF